MSQLALPLIGREGVAPGGSGPAPLPGLAAKEAISLLNSNSLMLAQAALALAEVRALLDAATLAGALSMEGFRGNLRSWRREVDWSLNVLRPIVGTDDPVRCLRPPYGNSDSELLHLLGSRKLAQALWSVDPEDWRNPSPATIVSRVVSHAAVGAVVLLHEIHANTVAALPSLISALRARGYSFVEIC